MEWVYTDSLVEYRIAEKVMKERVAFIKAHQKDEMIWGLQHPPLFTAGSSAENSDLLDDLGFPVYQVGRGGKFTYHGPGQLVIYVMIDLQKHTLDIRQYVAALETWLVNGFKLFGIEAGRRANRIGIWVTNPNGNDEKIAAIGIRVTKGVTWHGVALNISPELTHFRGIIPCGLAEFSVTSMQGLGKQACLKEVFEALKGICPFK